MNSNHKNNVSGAASTAAGAAAGVIFGAAVVSPETASAGTVDSELEVVDYNHDQAEGEHESYVDTSDKNSTVEVTSVEEHAAVEEPVMATEEHNIEIVGYEHISGPDGQGMDMAVLDVDGYKIDVYDVDMDGKADVMVCDINNNGVIEEGEYHIVTDQNIDMQPFQDHVYDQQYAHNDMPDYVNDADVDSYMA